MTAPKDKVEKKEKVRHVATVMEAKHGWFFNRHTHYIVNVVEARESLETDTIKEAAVAATKMANRLMSDLKVKVLITEDIEITTQDEIKNSKGKLLSFLTSKE